MKTCRIAPLMGVLAVLMCPAAADKRPSLISTLLDLLPEIEELGDNSHPGTEIPAAEAEKAEEAIEIFSLFTPFIRDVVRGKAESENRTVSESTMKTLDTMERIIPKFMNIVVALGSRTKSNPEDEPLLDDFTGLAPRGSYAAPRQSRPRESALKGPKIEKELLSNVLQQSTKLISQITNARASTKSSSDEAPKPRVEAPPLTNYFINSETTSRPQTRRRRPSGQRTYSTTAAPRVEESSEETEAPARSYTPSRATYTPPTTARATYTPPTTAVPVLLEDSDDQQTLRTYSTSTRVSSGSQPGSSVSFFSLPTSRSSRRQRVTRGSDFQVKPQRYFYLD